MDRCAECKPLPLACLRCRSLAAVLKYVSAGHVAASEGRGRTRSNEIRAMARIEMSLIAGEVLLQNNRSKTE